ncbi:MAG: polysaccharide biosynthesis/export family protein [Bacteroidales bacterium]|nr:polysaccharide biosynthesis/export family protein [Bacteroidales bacterium]
MKFNLFRLLPSVLAILTGSLMFFSCVPQHKMLYLQDKHKSEGNLNYANERSFTYLIQPGDNLYIKVVSLDEKTATLFNPLERTTGGGSNVNDQGIYLNSYTVSDEGNIEFPLAGKITVQNLNVEEVKEKIQKILDQYLKETVLIVKLVNFNLTVLGEVRRPGQYKVYQSEINLFEAMAMAGDLTEFANRRQVQIVRQTKTGSEVVEVNLEKADILSSDYFYLKPNDMIYIKPMPIKQFGFAAFPYTLIFSSISTALLLINFFK